MRHRVADKADMQALLPPDVEKSAYDPDLHDLVFCVNVDTGRIDSGRAVDSDKSAFQMFNLVVFDDWAELVPIGPWKPIPPNQTDCGH